MNRMIFPSTWRIAHSCSGRAAAWLLSGFLLLVISGCMAAPILIGAAAAGGMVFKTIQTSTGGSVEVAVDTKGLPLGQKERFRQIKRLAVWPDGGGMSVAFSEELTGRSGFQIITPSRVSQALQARRQTDDLTKMTRGEVSQVMNAICLDTGAQGVIYGRATGGGQNMNMFSLERANVTRTFSVMVHAARDENPFMQFPVTLKVNVGGNSSSETELVNLMAKEVARALLEL